MKGTLAQITPTNRVIRVFVSSTFHDMKEEREELVKRVFPRLRKICEQRGVTWGAVDLRWGITDEQAAEGKVLPICLREIDECRPFFIGMLGERYGHIPDEIPDELIEREPWLADHKGKSIPELEILHGVLNNPESAEHAYFYIRDPADLQKKSKSVQADNPEKLNSLKERIRKSGFPVRENYPNPKELGKIVYEDLLSVIDELFPEGSELDPLDRDTLDHEAYAHAKFRIYIGRQEYFDRLDQHVESEDQPLVVLGESGSGKSALLANWANTYREKNPDDLLICHFIGATQYSADWTAMLRRIMGEFKRRYDIPDDIPGEPDKLRSTFANWLHMASTLAKNSGHKIVLILDALNQLEDKDAALDLVWLPPFIPEHVRIIVSTLPGRPLDDLNKRELQTMNVRSLENDERKKLIKEYLGQYAKALSDERLERIASSDKTRNPLYLRALLEELRVFGVHEHLDRAIEHYLSSNTIPELFEKVLKRLEQDYEREWPGLVEDAMTFIRASRQGLTEEELLELCGAAGNPLPRVQWVEFYSAVEKLLICRSGLIGFEHDYIREAIMERFLQKGKDQKNVHLRISNYFSRHELTHRKVEELPWQLAEAEEWQRLYDLLAELEFFKAAWLKDEFYVKATWAKVEKSSDLSLLDAYQPVLDAPEDVSDSDIIMNISDLLEDTGHPSEVLLLQRFLTELYRCAGEEKKLASSLLQQGHAYDDLGKYDNAMELYRQSERICRDCGDMSGLSISLNNQGIILWNRGDLDGAIKLYKESEQIFRDLDDKARLAKSLGNQGLILSNRGNFDGALKLLKESEHICRELCDKSGLSRNLGNQGTILHKQGDLDGAMELYKESVQIKRELGDKKGLSINLGNQGIVLRQRGDLEGAMKLFQEKEDICRMTGNKRGLSVCLGNQGFILYQRGDTDGAMKLYREQESISRELGDKRGLSHSLNYMGEVFKKLGEFDKAMNLFKEAEDICREICYPDQLAESLSRQADVLFRKGNQDLALPIAEEAYEIATKHGYAEIIQTSKPILDKIRAELG